jgi:hypothetical protein
VQNRMLLYVSGLFSLSLYRFMIKKWQRRPGGAVGRQIAELQIQLHELLFVEKCFELLQDVLTESLKRLSLAFFIWNIVAVSASLQFHLS